MTAATEAHVAERERYARWIGACDVPPDALLIVSAAAFKTLLDEGELKYNPIRHAIGSNPIAV